MNKQDNTTNSKYTKKIEELATYPNSLGVQFYLKVFALVFLGIFICLVIIGILSENKLIPPYIIAIPAVLMFVHLIIFIILATLMRKAQTILANHINQIKITNPANLIKHLKLINCLHWRIKNCNFAGFVSEIEEYQRTHNNN